MKLIIDIDKESYKEIKKIVADGNDMFFTDKLIANGTPFDSVIEDIKAEIDYERNRYLNLVGDSGYCNGLNKALKIIDNIGEAEREEN